MSAAEVHQDYLGPAEGQADFLRNTLGLGSGAISDMFDLLAQQGLQVVRWPMGREGLDGFYLRRQDWFLVGINSAKRLVRQRFTAAHELGHHLFDRQTHLGRNLFETEAIAERRANAFAAFLLMPRAGVDRWYRRSFGTKRQFALIDATAVVHLARGFGMSYEATLYHLRDLGYLTSVERAKLATASPDQIAWRLGYDVDFDKTERDRRVLPPDFVRWSLQAYGSGRISLGRLADLLRVDCPQAEAIAEAAGVRPPALSIDHFVTEARNA